MAFTPTSTIYLCNVPFDNSYKNIVRFNKANTQYVYFYNHKVDILNEYLTVRTSKENGGILSSIKVNRNIDSLYKSNYMMYQNANHGEKWFYAFITKLVYINEATTEIFFETDVFQTWWFSVQKKECFVEREHTETDELYEHIIPEPIPIDEYDYIENNSESVESFNEVMNSYAYVVALTENPFSRDGGDDDIDLIRGEQSGVFQGLYFMCYESSENLETFLKDLDQEIVMAIIKVPKFNLSGAMSVDPERINGFITETKEPSKRVVSLNNNIIATIQETHKYKNNKIYSYPYTCLSVVVGNKETEYALEYFNSAIFGRTPAFTVYGDVSLSPSVMLCPYYYDGVETNVLKAITISNFPQCSFSTDAYKIWLAKNTPYQALNVAKGVSNIALGVAAMGVSGGVGALVGGNQIMGGATTLANTLANDFSARKLPNNGNEGSPTNNLLVGMKHYNFKFYVKIGKERFLRRIDDYFTRYGYKVDTVKIPNIWARPHYNYIKTIDCNFDTTGGFDDMSVPNDDLTTLKGIFDRGVTIWDKDSTVGDYSVDNSPVGEE